MKNRPSWAVLIAFIASACSPYNASLKELFEFYAASAAAATWAELNHLVQTAPDGTVILLSGDMPATGPGIVVPPGKTITLAAPQSTTITRQAGLSGPLFEVSPGAALILGGSHSQNLVIDGNKQAGVTAVGPLVTINGTLILHSGAGLQNNRNGDSGNFPGGGALCFGTLIMNPGSHISQNERLVQYDEAGGGGVGVVGNGRFLMKGGEVRDNKAERLGSVRGGGVYVGGGGQFTMEGGLVTGNQVVTSTSGQVSGGGVAFVGNGATGALMGGAISLNTLRGENAAGAGVVLYSSGNVTMEEGMAIQENEIILGGLGTITGQGGGVAVLAGSSFTMNGGLIANNKITDTTVMNLAAIQGGGLYHSSTSSRLRGGRIQGNVIPNSFFAFGPGIYIDNWGLELSGSVVAAQDNPFYIPATGTFLISGPLTPPEGEKTARLDLSALSSGVTIAQSVAPYVLTQGDADCFRTGGNVPPAWESWGALKAP